MSKQNENNRSAAPNANDFLGGRFLMKEDLCEPVTVSIGRVWSEWVSNADTPKLVVKFEEFGKPLILNKTNTRKLIALYGEETASWSGKSVLLFVAKDVQYAGRLVGGIRIGEPQPVNGVAVEKVNELAESLS